MMVNTNLKLSEEIKNTEAKFMKKSNKWRARAMDIWNGKIPEVDVEDKEGNLRGLVEWNDNLSQLVQQPSVPFPESMGITQLKSGEFAVIEQTAGMLFSYVVPTITAVQMILESGNYLLLFKFDLLETLKELIETDEVINYLANQSIDLMIDLTGKWSGYQRKSSMVSAEGV